MLTWSFEGLSPTRAADLLNPFRFSELATRLGLEARRLSFKNERGTHEAKGWWRPEFMVEVSGDAFDLFFNSPHGYRGQFLRSIAEGQTGNALVLKALARVLLSDLNEAASTIDQIAASLASEFAKVWIDEHSHAPRDPILIVEVKVPAWEVAARRVRERLDVHDSTLTPKEVERIFGVRAPCGRVLKVMGAWVRSDGSFVAVPSKQGRGQDIRNFGVS